MKASRTVLLAAVACFVGATAAVVIATRSQTVTLPDVVLAVDPSPETGAPFVAESSQQTTVPINAGPSVPEVRQLIVRDSVSGEVITAGTALASPLAAAQERDVIAQPARMPPEEFSLALGVDGHLPTVIETDPENLALWVLSPGYAPELIFLHDRETGALMVDLAPAGDLLVTVRGGHDRCGDDGTYVRLVNRGRRIGVDEYGVDSSLTLSGYVEFTSCPAGVYEVSIVRGGPRKMRSIALTTSVTINAGESTPVTLDLSNAREASSLRVVVTNTGRDELFLDARRSFKLYAHQDVNGQLTALGRLVSESEWFESVSGRVWEREFHCLEPGTYTISLRPYGLTQTIELLPGHASVVHLDLPDLASLKVNIERCADATNAAMIAWGYVGERAELRSLITLGDRVYQPALPEAMQAFPLADNLSVTIRCEPRPIWLRALASDRGSATLVAEPTTERESQLDIHCEAFHCATAQILFHPGPNSMGPTTTEFLDALRFSDAGAGGQLMTWRVASTAASRAASPGALHLFAYFDAPGRYQVTFGTGDEERVREVIAGTEPGPIDVMLP